MSVAQGQQSLTFATEQVLLAAATLVWCTPQSQSMLFDGGTIVCAAELHIFYPYHAFGGSAVNAWSSALSSFQRHMSLPLACRLGLGHDLGPR